MVGTAPAPSVAVFFSEVPVLPPFYSSTHCSQQYIVEPSTLRRGSWEPTAFACTSSLSGVECLLSLSYFMPPDPLPLGLLQGRSGDAGRGRREDEGEAEAPAQHLAAPFWPGECPYERRVPELCQSGEHGEVLM